MTADELAASVPVAIATCAEVVGLEGDDLLVIEALSRKLGVEAVHAAWDDSRVDWSFVRSRRDPFDLGLSYAT